MTTPAAILDRIVAIGTNHRVVVVLSWLTRSSSHDKEEAAFKQETTILIDSCY